MGKERRGYPSDVSEEEWALCAPYLTLLKEEAPQREHSLRAVLDALRYLVRPGCEWRMRPNDLPPWAAVHQQTQRGIKAGCFEALAHDLREVLRVAAGREARPTAAILDSRTLQSTPTSEARAGYDGATRPQRCEGACRRGHARPRARPAGERGQRAGPRPGRGARRGRAGGHGRKRRAGLRRPRLHRRHRRRSGRHARHPTPGRQTGPRQTRLRAAAQTLGRRTLLRAGPPASAGSPATTNASPPPSPVSTGSPSSASCSKISSPRVHDSL